MSAIPNPQARSSQLLLFHVHQTASYFENEKKHEGKNSRRIIAFSPRKSTSAAQAVFSTPRILEENEARAAGKNSKNREFAAKKRLRPKDDPPTKEKMKTQRKTGLFFIRDFS
jgi:hypothetical protein